MATLNLQQLDASVVKGVGLHFQLEINDKHLAYCYIRKNASLSFKSMFLKLSKHRDFIDRHKPKFDFLRKYHLIENGDDLADFDHSICVLRDPCSRLISLYLHKFIARHGARDILQNFEEVTGTDPSTTTFRFFVENYLSVDESKRDVHTWAQTSHLRRIRYSDAIKINDLHDTMTTIVGRALADQCFTKKQNATEGNRVDMAGACDYTANELAELWTQRGIIPSEKALVSTDIAGKISELYANDVELLSLL